MRSLRHGAPTSRTLGASTSHIKELSFPFCLFDLGYSVKNIADLGEFAFAQLWSPGIVTGFMSNNAFMNQCPKHTPDVALHGRNEKNFRKLVHQPRQRKKLRSPPLEISLQEVEL